MIFSFSDNNNTPQEQTTPPFPFSMSSDGNNDVTIPSVFVSGNCGNNLRSLLATEKVQVLLTSPALHPSGQGRGAARMCESKGSHVKLPAVKNNEEHTRERTCSNSMCLKQDDVTHNDMTTKESRSEGSMYDSGNDPRQDSGTHQP